MEVDIIRLRDLPGIMEIEALCHVPKHFDYYNIGDTMERIDVVSVSLFSVSYDATDYDGFEWSDVEDAPSEAQWDGWLSNAMKPYSVTRPFWEALGWDITDGKGRELNCAHYFTKQIIIAESGWVEGVQLTPDGSGKEPAYEGPELTEEELAQKLEREAQEFLLRQNSR